MTEGENMCSRRLSSFASYGGVMVSVLASSVVDRGLGPLSGPKSIILVFAAFPHH